MHVPIKSILTIESFPVKFIGSSARFQVFITSSVSNVPGSCSYLRRLYSGFIFGTCLECKPSAFHGFRLDQIIDHYIKPLNIPAYSGAMIGHQEKIFTIPEGIEVEMDADQGTIKMLESAVR